jgi:hypothetical protein
MGILSFVLNFGKWHIHLKKIICHLDEKTRREATGHFKYTLSKSVYARRKSISPLNKLVTEHCTVFSKSALCSSSRVECYLYLVTQFVELVSCVTEEESKFLLKPSNWTHLTETLVSDPELKLTPMPSSANLTVKFSIKTSMSQILQKYTLINEEINNCFRRVSLELEN